jgi:glycosyltransferase involved in cell wall biosynthesis
MTPASLSVLLPIKDEADNIVRLLDEIERALGPLGHPFEVIAVDDGSTDGSRALLEREAGRRAYLRVIRFRRNVGQTAAFDAGFRHATGDIIVTLDADLQNDPADIAPMLRMVEHEGYDFVTGWRRTRHDDLLLRKLPSRIGNWLIRLVTRTRIHDLGCSLRVYRRELTNELRLYGEMHRFIGVLLENIGGRVGEVEGTHRPRVAGVSKYRWPRAIKVVLDLLTVWFMHGYGTKPSHVFGGFGLVLLSASGLLTGWVLVEKYAFAIWVHRNPLLLGAVFLGVVGVQFVGLGLLAELLVRTYFEASGRVPYSVARTIGFERRTRDSGTGVSSRT